MPCLTLAHQNFDDIVLEFLIYELIPRDVHADPIFEPTMTIKPLYIAREGVRRYTYKIDRLAVSDTGPLRLQCIDEEG